MGGLITFVVPILNTLVLRTTCKTISLLIIKEFNSASKLSTISAKDRILGLIAFMIIRFTVNVAILVTHRLNRGGPRRVNSIVNNTTVMFATVSIKLFVIVIYFTRPVTVLVRTPTRTIRLAAICVHVYNNKVFFVITCGLLSTVFHKLKSDGSPLLFMLITYVVGIFNSLVLITNFRVGTTNTTVTAIFTRTVDIIFTMILLVGGRLPFGVEGGSFYLGPRYGGFLVVKLPLTLRRFLARVSFLTLYTFMGQLKLRTSSNCNITYGVMGFTVLMPDTLVRSVTSFISRGINTKGTGHTGGSVFAKVNINLIIKYFIFALMFLGKSILTKFFSASTTIVRGNFTCLEKFTPRAVMATILFDVMKCFGKGSEAL